MGIKRIANTHLIDRFDLRPRPMAPKIPVVSLSSASGVSTTMKEAINSEIGIVGHN